MSLLGSLGSLTKVVTDPGALVQDALNKVLPKEISGVVGNVAAGLVDYYSGNEVMAAKHGLEALQDLPQMAKCTVEAERRRHGRLRTLPQAPDSSVGRFVRNCWNAGESPVAPAAAQRPRNQYHHQRERHAWPERAPQTQETGPSGNMAWRHTPGQGAWDRSHRTTAGGTRHTTIAAPKVSSTPTPITADAGSTGSASSANSSAKTTSTDSTAPTGTANSTAATGTANSTGSTASANSSASTGSADSSAKAGSADSSAAMATLNNMSDSDFMNAIQSGKLDPSIKNDPAAMRAIQARMDAISQMNQLLTSMMQAMHQMEMAIIQNIRV